ncbi:hypothetical protein Pcinc_022944 [Petrolisthes cinctipes]|uniref:PCNA-interacting partner n=1 Tax=Petrolisthes cinctipes TaxID=88211 RepID=A0AAE1FE45_PETCI|nr:hypothetical protein Pcinc_022944 [Petrolisthes cinctipes]
MDASVNNQTTIFFTSSLDSKQQRQAVVTKVHEFLTHTVDTNYDASKVVYLGQAGWEHVGQISCLTRHLMSACRNHALLPSPRTILLSVNDQYQALQLCLARINKKKHGEFMAAVSDVMDAWNEMYRHTLNSNDGDSEELNTTVVCSQLKSQDPCYQEMQEVIRDYEEFLNFSGCMDHFCVYKCLKKNLKDNQEFRNYIFSQVYIIEGIDELPTMEKEFLKLIFKNSDAYKLLSEFNMAEWSSGSPDLNLSGITENDANSSLVVKESDMNLSTILESDDTSEEKQELSSDIIKTCDIDNDLLNDSVKLDSEERVKVRKIDSSLLEYMNTIPRKACNKAFHASETEMYIERLVLAHLRLLINTRDDLAFTLAYNMPGRDITQQGFSDIRSEAHEKNMPIYQIILSFILRHRLGGKGYQADSSNPILQQVKPLGEFVDSIMKLQNIVEEVTDPRKSAAQVLVSIKNNLSRMKGCVIKRTTIDKVWNRLNCALGCLMDEAGSRDRVTKQGSVQTSTLQPCLKHLMELCDENSGHVWDEGIVSVLGENFLTQYTSKKLHTTPIKIPTVLSLFRSPDVENQKDEDSKKEDLKSRALRKSSIGEKATALPKRYQSACSWAPSDLSPISGMIDVSQASPVSGPSLKVEGRTGKTNTQSWREIVNSVTQKHVSKDGDVVVESSSLSPEKDTLPENTAKPDSMEAKPKKKSSKRSLLTDITNVSSNPVIKKQKQSEKKTGMKGKEKRDSKLTLEEYPL